MLLRASGEVDRWRLIVPSDDICWGCWDEQALLVIKLVEGSIKEGPATFETIALLSHVQSKFTEACLLSTELSGIAETGEFPTKVWERAGLYIGFSSIFVIRMPEYPYILGGAGPYSRSYGPLIRFVPNSRQVVHKKN